MVVVIEQLCPCVAFSWIAICKKKSGGAMKRVIHQLYWKILLYAILAFVFLCNIPEEQAVMELAYTDMYLFTILFLIYGSVILSLPFETIEVYRFNRLTGYFLYKMRYFTVYNMVLIVSVALIHSLVVMLQGNAIGYVWWFALQQFLVFSILYLTVLSFSLVPQYKVLAYVTLFLYFGMFLLYIMTGPEISIPLNIYTGWFMAGDILSIMLQYLVWLAIPVLIIYNRKDGYTC